MRNKEQSDAITSGQYGPKLPGLGRAPTSGVCGLWPQRHCHLAAVQKSRKKTEVTPSYAPSVSRACLSPSAVALMTISSFSSIELSMTSICFRQLLSPLSSSEKKN